MAKALFIGLPLAGHTNPSLPLIRELVSRGEEVVYYSTDEFAAAVERTGAGYRPYRGGSILDLRQLFARTDAISWLLMRTAAAVLEADLETWRAERPDYLIVDSVAPWGQWAGKILGVPVVTSVTTFALNRHVLAFAARHGVQPKSVRQSLSKLRYVAKALVAGRRLRRRYRVNGPGVMASVAGRSGLNIVYTSRYFQPCAETFDQRFRFIGPSMSSRIEAAGLAWDQVCGWPVVYVSLGTLFNTDAAFYRICYEAFGGQELQVIMATGTSVSVESLGVPPANFIVRPHVPQLDVLVRASAFVTHGGMNSVSESLYSGVPMVVIPQMGEQAIVGRRVEELGAGLYVSKEEVTAERLRSSVRQVLSDVRFKHQADIVGASLKEASGVTAAADAIAEFTRSAAAGS